MGKLEVRSPLFNLSKRTKSTDEATSCNFVVPEAIMDTDALDNDPQVTIVLGVDDYRFYVSQNEHLELWNSLQYGVNEESTSIDPVCWEKEPVVDYDTVYSKISPWDRAYWECSYFGVIVNNVKRGARLKITIPIYSYEITWYSDQEATDTSDNPSEYATIELDLTIDDEDIFACDEGAKVSAVYNMEFSDDVSFGSIDVNENSVNLHNMGFQLKEDSAFALPQPPDDNTGLMFRVSEIYWEIDNCPTEVEDVSES